MKVPFVDLSAQYKTIKTEIDKAISNVITDTAFIGGKYVQNFENEFASLLGVKHVISCGNGTDSLFIIMKMLGIGYGDEVITPVNSWISSAETISLTAAKPVFIDVHPDYYSLDEKLLESKITGKTRAIMAVHLQGQACEMDSITEICRKYNLHLIEDCAQAHFTSYRDKRVGLFGVAASFSFFPGKNLGAYGDAGCMVTNDDSLAEKLKMFGRHGALKKHEHVIEGINSRMDGMQASILSAKLPHILKWTTNRTDHAELYSSFLSGINGVTTPSIRPGTVHTFHLYVIRATRRDKLAEYLKSRGIETLLHYPRILSNLPAYQYLHHSSDDFPVANRLQGEILSLPMYPEMTNEMIGYVSDSIRSFYNG